MSRWRLNRNLVRTHGADAAKDRRRFLTPFSH